MFLQIIFLSVRPDPSSFAKAAADRSIHRSYERHSSLRPEYGGQAGCTAVSKGIKFSFPFALSDSRRELYRRVSQNYFSNSQRIIWLIWFTLRYILLRQSYEGHSGRTEEKNTFHKKMWVMVSRDERKKRIFFYESVKFILMYPGSLISSVTLFKFIVQERTKEKL